MDNERQVCEKTGNNKNLKFVQVHPFYPAAIDIIYSQDPLLKERPYREQIDALIKSGFTGIHLYAPYMKSHGYETELIIPNNRYSQLQWLKENNVKISPEKARDAAAEIVRIQAEALKPDIIHFGEPLGSFDSRFIRGLSFKPGLVTGWRAALTSKDTDWSEFDIIFSAIKAIRDTALKLGARDTMNFMAGFPGWFTDVIKDVKPDSDVVFCGQITPQIHKRRNTYLQHIAEMSLSQPSPFSCAYYLSGDPACLTPEFNRLNRGSRFGLDMLRALRTGKISIDAQAHMFLFDSSGRIIDDIARNQTANMRIFETTGSGVFLLTEHKDNLSDYFEIGKEIETFRDKNELVEKILYYKDHPDKREEIAANGQKKCLEEHSMEKRCGAFDRIISGHFEKNSSPSPSIEVSEKKQPGPVSSKKTALSPFASIPSGERPLRVVHLSWVNGGGAGSAAYRLHKGLADKGADSLMLVLQKAGPDPKVRILPTAYNGYSTASPEVDNGGYNELVKNDRRWSILLSRYPDRPKDAELFTDTKSGIRLELVREIQEADIIHLHWVAGVVDIERMRAAFAGKPVVWTLHDMNPFTGGCHYSGGCNKYETECGACPNLGSKSEMDVSRYFHRLKQEGYDNTALNIVTPSIWLKECSEKSTLFRDFPHFVIPNGIDTSVFQPGLRNEIRKRENIPADRFLLLFGAAALHIKRKGFAFLLDALEKALESGLNEKITLGIYGNIPEGMKLPDKYHIIRFGHIFEEERMAEIYSCSDAFIIPTIEDNLPNTVIESLACGVPVIGFRTGGVPDMIEHLENGFLVEQRDIDGLIKGIEWAISQKQDRERISGICRETALNRYDTSVQAGSFLKLYSKILQNREMAMGLEIEGQKELESGNYEKARSLFDRAAKISPCSAGPFNGRGTICLNEGNRERAALEFIASLERDPYNRDALTRLSGLTDKINTDIRIRDHFKGYMEQFPDDEEMLPHSVRIEKEYLKNETDRGKTIDRYYAKREYKVTVILTALNDMLSFEESLSDIVSQQDAQDIEIVCIDAAHILTDYSAIEKASLNRNNIRVFVPKEPVKRFTALNHGIILSSSPLCMSMISSDRLKQDACTTLAEKLNRNDEYKAVYGDTLLSLGPHSTFSEYTPAKDYNGRLNLYDCTAADLVISYNAGPHVMWEKELHERCGFFNTDLEVEAGQDFWIRVCRKNRLKHIPAVTGMICMDKKIPLRVPTASPQYSRIRSKYRSFPHNRGVIAPLSNDFFSDPEKTGALNDFAARFERLISEKKTEEAIEYYKSNRGNFPLIPDLDKFDSIVDRLRRSYRK